MKKRNPVAAPEKKVPILKKLVYKGFTVAQHIKSLRVMIDKDGKPVHHSIEDHLLTDRELRQMVDDYIVLAERLGEEKMKPVLFNTDMVRANKEGRKGVTRRIIPWDKVNAVLSSPARKENPDVLDEVFVRNLCDCRYAVGDILYVRETWAITSAIRDIADDGPVYMADLSELELRYLRDKGFKWRPSIHMPKELARLFLRVTDIRAERLQDITAEECELEGAATINNPLIYADEVTYNVFCRGEMKRLWDRTTNKADIDKYGWDANPWVWVIHYERCEKPKGV